jgi:hypothetical protein
MTHYEFEGVILLSLPIAGVCWNITLLPVIQYFR